MRQIKKAIKQVGKDWDQYISHMLCDSFDRNAPTPNTQFYAITLQENNFEKPVAGDILGIMKVTYPAEKKESFIDFLQANPKYIHEPSEFPELTKFLQKLFHIKPLPPTEYTNIGTAMVQSLEKMKPENCMRLVPLKTCTSFYSNLGFNFESVFSKYMRKENVNKY